MNLKKSVEMATTVSPHLRFVHLPGRLVAVLTLAVLLTGLTGVERTQAGSSAQFVSAACPFTVSSSLTEGKDVRCGYLVVPEDRTNPGGKTIKLAVAIFKSRVAHPAPDPVIMLAGGPGGALVGLDGPTINASNAADKIGDRDLILVDQRGAGLSQPALSCPELQKPFKPSGSTPSARLSSQIAFQVKGTTACHDRLSAAGVNLDAYNTPANAADIADLRVALGLPEVNLYGGSYGSRLALAVMRDHPDGIRSVVIDAVAHPQFNQFTDAIPNFWRSLNLIFTQCAKSRSCKADYPDLKGAFTRIVTRLNAKPLTIQGTRVDGITFANGLMGALYVDSVIPLVPRVLTDMDHGNYSLLKQLAPQLNAPDTSTFGMYLAMECGDDLTGAQSADMTARAKILPGAIRSLMIKTSYTAYIKECTAWQAKPVASVYHDPVVSAIPTLIMTSEFDPRTPPANGKWVAKTLSHSYLFTYPGLGHGARYHQACPSSMVWAFFDHPTQKPNSACIAGMSDPFK